MYLSCSAVHLNTCYLLALLTLILWFLLSSLNSSYLQFWFLFQNSLLRAKGGVQIACKANARRLTSALRFKVKKSKKSLVNLTNASEEIINPHGVDTIMAGWPQGGQGSSPRAA